MRHQWQIPLSSLLMVQILFILSFISLNGQEKNEKRTILGQTFYLLAEETLAFTDQSFRSLWESCLQNLIHLEFKLVATGFIADEHIILASKNLPSFHFTTEENQGVSTPDLNWLSGKFWLQISISQEIYGLYAKFLLGTDKSSLTGRIWKNRAQRIIHQFIDSLKKKLNPSFFRPFD